MDAGQPGRRRPVQVSLELADRATGESPGRPPDQVRFVHERRPSEMTDVLELDDTAR